MNICISKSIDACGNYEKADLFAINDKPQISTRSEVIMQRLCVRMTHSSPSWRIISISNPVFIAGLFDDVNQNNIDFIT